MRAPVHHGLSRRGGHWASRCAAAWLIIIAGWQASVAQAALSIDQWHTSTGVKVLFVAADAIPMLDIEVSFDAGARLDPPAREGLASMTAALLDAGAGGRDEAAVADAFARIGARRSNGAGIDTAWAGLRSLVSEPELDRAVDLLVDMIARPAFPVSVLERERERSVQSIGESLQRPGAIMSRLFSQLVYPDHPYGTSTSIESMQAITREAVVQFHREHYVRSRATIAMIGAIDRARAERIAERLVADLPQGRADNHLPPVRMPEPRERRIEHPASQSHIITGAPLMARGDPDYFPLLVANHVLGGGSFLSRLYAEIRDKRGYAYSVSSGFSLRRQTGVFSISLQTARQNTDPALQVVRQVLADFVRDGPTDAEIAAAQDNLAGSFALSMDSNGEILDLISRIGVHDLPLDWLDRWPARVRAVTPAQVRDALTRRLHPDRMVTVVVGQATATP